MNHHTLDYENLTKLLFSLEEETLKIPDTEAVTTLTAGRNGVDDVTRLISAELFKQQDNSAAHVAQVSSKVRPRRSVTTKSEADVALLRRILMARPELSPQLHAVLSAGGTPGAQEVERLISELMRKGMFSRDE